MKHVMIALVKLYRRFISPIKPPCCRFTPTCSAYALEAFQKRGFFAGMILTVWRILRCNPFSKGGYDPVPERGFRRSPECRIEKDECCHGSCSQGASDTDATEKEKDNLENV